MQKRLLFLIAAVMMVSTMIAQVTTSEMSGVVTVGDAKGEPVIGATVQAVHGPSGTRYATVTNVDGRFNIQGMRTGGPYSVTSAIRQKFSMVLHFNWVKLTIWQYG